VLENESSAAWQIAFLAACRSGKSRSISSRTASMPCMSTRLARVGHDAAAFAVSVMVFSK
jgi:hypothetical protein